MRRIQNPFPVEKVGLIKKTQFFFNHLNVHWLIKIIAVSSEKLQFVGIKHDVDNCIFFVQAMNDANLNLSVNEYKSLECSIYTIIYY